MNPRLKSGFSVILLLGLLAGCSRQPPQPPATPSDNYFQTHFQNESQFIVETILTDLAEMAAFAKSSRLPGELSVSAVERPDSLYRKPVYDVTIAIGKKESVRRELRVNQPIWAPELYENLARTLVGKHPTVISQPDSTQLSVLTALTDLRPATILVEAEQVSRLLEANFSNPTLHERAAVILGAFALRESSGTFYDVRAPLCRMTAHLALARALSAGSGVGINGRAADAMLSTLMNNQRGALEKLRQLESEPKLKPWVNALRVRNTYDYRELKDATQPTLLERIMCCVAISHCIRADAGWEEVPDGLKKECSDFARIANAGSYSVGLGHQLRESSLALELAEIAEVHTRLLGREMEQGDLLTFLNQSPERCFAPGTNRVLIIGSGQWAGFLQRHLCHTLEQNFNFLQRKWGVPEAAREFATECDDKFGGLRMYPFLRRLYCTTEKEYRLAVDEGLPVTAATPHLVPPEIWIALFNPPFFAARYVPKTDPHVNDWHNHNPPPGTAYTIRTRLADTRLISRADSPMILGELHGLAPYEGRLADGVLWVKYHDQETYDQAEEIYRPLLEYSARENLRLAAHATNDPPRYEQVMTRYAQLNPVGYFTLGRFFAERRDEARALAYYEKGVASSQDAVAMSQNCGWLVRYYFRKGEREKAEALADRAAEVYSEGGLRTKAELMEDEEKYDEALDYYQRIEERYNRPGPLAGFCVRYKAATGNSRFDKLVQARLTTLFPRGIEKVRLADFNSPPDEGVLISQDNELLSKAGLKKGDIIVALDGIRVYDMTQYMYTRELTNAAAMRLTIWNGKEFLEKEASPPKRRFGVPFLDFRQPARR